MRERWFQPFNRGRLQQVVRRRGQRYGLLLIIITALVALAAICGYRVWSGQEKSSPPQASEIRITQASEVQVSIPEEPDVVSPTPDEGAFRRPPAEQFTIVEGTIGKKGSLYEALRAQKVSAGIIHIIVSTLDPLVDFGKCQRDDRFTLWTDEDGALVKFAYETGPLDIYEIRREGYDYIALKQEIPVDQHLVKVCGEIRSSLFEAINELNERDQLAILFADIFAWEIDFYQDLQVGDQFTILVEKIFKEGEFIQYGNILAAEYRTSSTVHRGFYFEGSNGKGGHFDEKGHSLRKAFLRAPLQYRRISSGYTRSRRHPILGGLHPHYGIDYAAPTGTAIWSVADGVVVEKTRDKAYGWYLAIRHPQGYKTYYGHLSRFAKGIKKGAHVTQKQVIGYVGSTGYSTGPHLDYRLKKHGRYRNPLKEKFPSGRPVARQDLERYMETKNRLLKYLEDEAFTVTRYESVEKQSISLDETP